MPTTQVSLDTTTQGTQNSAGEGPSDPGRNMDDSWPLYGRSTALEKIGAAYASGARGVLLTGPAGVGKTRLARQVLLDAEAAGMTTAWTAGTHGAGGVPFGAFVRFLPVLGEDATFLDRSQLMAALVDRLVHLGDRVVLGIDDAPQLDPHSEELVRQLLLDGRVRLLLTARADAPRQTALERECTVLPLAPFGEEQTAALLRTVLGGHVHPLTARRLWEWTGGNALHLRELVTSGCAARQLTDDSGAWLWTGPPPVPGDIAAALSDRLAELSPAEVEAVRLLALGEPLDVDVMDHLCGAAVVESLEEKGLVSVDVLGAAPLLRLVHPLYAEWLVARTPVLAARRLQRRLAVALRPSGDCAPTRLVRVAGLRIAAGEEPTTGELCEAAEAALSLFDAGTALRLLDRADRGPIVVTTLRARALALLGDAAQAEELLASVDADGLGDAELVAWATVRAENLVTGLMRPADALDLVDDVLARSPAARADEPLAGIRVLALTYADRGEEVADRSSPGSAPSWLAPALACCHAVLGRIDDGLAHLQPALASPDTPPWLRLGAEVNRCGLLAEAGRYDDLDAAVAEMSAWGVASGSSAVVGYARALAGIASIFRGRFQTAEVQLSEAASSVRTQDPISALRWVLAWRAGAASLVGAPGAGRDLAQSHAVAAQAPQFLMMLGSDRVAETLFLTGLGEGVEARAFALMQARYYAARGRPLWAVSQALLASFLGGAPAAAAAVAGLPDPQGAAFSSLALRHVRAAAARDAHELLAAAEDWAVLGAFWCASEAARAGHDLLAGRSASTAATALLADLLARCEPVTRTWWPGRGPDVLTSRERQVARMAARGLTNREIAERLTVSVRTVENHLHAAYHKLGLRSRAELAPAVISGSAPLQPGSPAAR